MTGNADTLAAVPREPGPADADAMASGLRPGTYARGTETVDAILKAAHDVLIEEGASAFTIRRIATASGMKVGNVSYHFPRKEMLIKIMLDELLDSYDKLLESEVRQPAISPEDRLRLIVKLCLDDIAGKRTTRLFTELWALANHNTFVADRIRAFYQRVHDFIGEVVTELNPALSPDQVHTLALYISASMEGTTPFLGFEKPWAVKMPQITGIAAEAMVALVTAITPEQIAQVQ
jgi:AcrR family transcriptional regulator